MPKRLTNRIRREPQKYRWIPSKVCFDYIRNASDALYTISFRVVRFAVKEGLYETVITNLPADRFPPPLLCALYHKRWGVETSFQDLKHTLALTHFHAKKRPFIEQEIFAKMTHYNFAALFHLQNVFTQPKGRHLCRINATFATHIAREFLLDFVPAAIVEPLMAKFLLPARPGQQKPRNMRVKARTLKETFLK
nr:transposase [Flavonifractor sp.]